MKYLVYLIFSLYTVPAAAQNFFTKDGAFMDTTAIITAEQEAQLPYYYSVGGKYPKSSTTLLKQVKASIANSKQTYTGSGYITFRFVIDTTGRPLPKVQVLQTDEHYKNYRFDKALVDALYTFTKSLNGWKVARAGAEQALIYRAIISYKISNGQISNIIP